MAGRLGVSGDMDLEDRSATDSVFDALLIMLLPVEMMEDRSPFDG
jgi:hypothetical protein